MPPNDSENQAPSEKDIDAELAEATPPDQWSDRFIEEIYSERSDECHISISVTKPTFGLPVLGDIRGLSQAEATLADVAGLAGDITNLIRDELPGFVNDFLDPFFGRFTPPPNTFPFPIPRPLRLQMRVGALVAQIAAQLDAFPPRFSVVPPTPAAPHFSPVDGNVHIRSRDDTEVALFMWSKMTSSYTFGRTLGTSHTPSAAPLDRGTDRPWFGKAILPKAVFDPLVGDQFVGTGRSYVTQLGIGGEETRRVEGTLKLRAISHGASFPVRYCGNYGKLRVLVVPEAPCKVVWVDIDVAGPYEEDIARQEDRRFTAIEVRRDAARKAMVDIQNTLVMLGIAASTLPVAGPVINLALRRIVLMLEDRKETFSEKLNRMNRQQRALNYGAAEFYPEYGPIGGTEDTPLP
ncbi:hypothetical protein [uncultured Litoreibacter sp.]|uniref:hypothetical protein n=1 Tax=uncultured Litoreibacter sp. TaxID=1392394 RepID=UPI00260EA9BE|nr:hypothetical protein [uncultured Litoreibacter sp.]